MIYKYKYNYLNGNYVYINFNLQYMLYINTYHTTFCVLWMGRVWPSKAIVVDHTPVFIYANLCQPMTIQSIGLHQHDFTVIPQSQVAKEIKPPARFVFRIVVRGFVTR